MVTADRNLLVGGAGTDWDTEAMASIRSAWREPLTSIKFIISSWTRCLEFSGCWVNNFASLGYAYDGTNTTIWYGGNIAVIFGVQVSSSDMTFG